MRPNVGDDLLRGLEPGAFDADLRTLAEVGVGKKAHSLFHASRADLNQSGIQC